MFSWTQPIGLAIFFAGIGFLVTGIGVLLWGLKSICKKE
jgi:hypothetical protein